MKPFRKQLQECVKDGTAETIAVKNGSEKIEPREPFKAVFLDHVLFCNKYQKRCSSKVCLKERCEG